MKVPGCEAPVAGTVVRTTRPGVTIGVAGIRVVEGRARLEARFTVAALKC